MVGIATVYGSNGLGFESWQGQKIFSSPQSFRVALRPTQPSVYGVAVFFPGGKAAGRQFEHSAPSVPRLKGGVAVPCYGVGKATLPY